VEGRLESVRSTEHNTHVHVVCVAGISGSFTQHALCATAVAVPTRAKSEVNMQPRYTLHTHARRAFSREQHAGMFSVALDSCCCAEGDGGVFNIFFYSANVPAGATGRALVSYLILSQYSV
jgi:hypothetical protein